jgi:hypothetical protein
MALAVANKLHIKSRYYIWRSFLHFLTHDAFPVDKKFSIILVLPYLLANYFSNFGGSSRSVTNVNRRPYEHEG